MAIMGIAKKNNKMVQPLAMEKQLTPKEIEDIENGLKLGTQRIAQGNLFCFHCKKNPARELTLLITDQPQEGAPMGGIRTIITGICPVCSMFTSEQDKQNAAHSLFIEAIQQ